MVTGIICEYNPFHSGHKKQLDAIRAADPEGIIVCLMSGNFVQRGAPALMDKTLRAKAAVLCGADLVLELPVTYALRSAEGFASGGVSILKNFCDRLCFGAENPDTDALMTTANTLLSKPFSQTLREGLDAGQSFPAARQAALSQLGIDGRLVETPNNILAVEYCKAILTQKCELVPMPILRKGDYHATKPDSQNPSATFVRSQMLSNCPWEEFVPQEAAQCFRGATLHRFSAGEKAILYKLRTMSESDFEALPYGSEGLWRKLMHASREWATLEEIIENTKSKRYTRTRLDRMILCAILGITREMLEANAPYSRVLALNDKGRSILKQARMAGSFPNIGENMPDAYQSLEERSGNIYGLFANSSTEAPGREKKYRIFCQE